VFSNIDKTHIPDDEKLLAALSAITAKSWSSFGWLLLARRTAVSPLLRGIEVGLAHGFFLVGPFAKTGPLRNTEVAGTAGAFGAAGLVVILSVALTIYGIATFKEGAPSLAPSLTLSGRKKEADKLQTSQGWASFAGGFFFGGLSGVGWAYFLLYVLSLPYPVK
jgi:photosystem I subunit 11